MRRGADPAEVYCLGFDPLSKYLTCSSNKGTIHIFALRNDLSLSSSSYKPAEDINGQSQSMEAAPNTSA
jgi:WD40 repeat protein